MTRIHSTGVFLQCHRKLSALNIHRTNLTSDLVNFFTSMSEMATSVEHSYLMSPDMFVTISQLKKRIEIKYECHNESCNLHPS